MFKRFKGFLQGKQRDPQRGRLFTKREKSAFMEPARAEGGTVLSMKVTRADGSVERYDGNGKRTD